MFYLCYTYYPINYFNEVLNLIDILNYLLYNISVNMYICIIKTLTHQSLPPIKSRTLYFCGTFLFLVLIIFYDG